MAKITRATQTLFGGTGSTSDFGQFGSLAAGSPATTKTPSVIQSLAAWLAGWQAATIGALIPAYQDMNSVHYLAFYQICYMLQMGIPEWDSGTTYYIGSIVQDNGGLYVSLQDTNLNQAPSSQPAYWQNGLPSAEIIGVVKDYAGSVAPSGYFICDGTAVSRSTYANLFAVIGTTYGVGNGTTTFNIPDCRERTSVGYSSGSDTFGTLGLTPGAKTVNLQHSHGGLTGGVQFGGPGSLTAFTLDEPHQHPINNDLSASQSIVQPSIVFNKIIKY